VSEVQANIVIVGGGHAAAQLCAGLVAAGQGALVHLVSDEPELPYQRPPLSKAFLKTATEPVQAHRPADWYASSGISVHLGDAAVAINRAAQTVTLASGTKLPYATLVLATGTRARRLPGLAESLENVAILRSAADAHSLRSRLMAASAVTVLGGGFIGLEIAATAQVLGKQVTVLEAAPRLLGRSVSAELAAHVLNTHRAAGIALQLGVAVGDFEVQGGRLMSLRVNGEPHSVDLLVLGIGAVAETALAEAAGLPCDNGITVDAQMRTADPHILAVGDCANFPHAGSGRRTRLESVPNANEQARTAVATISGHDEPHRALPWFWSEQGALRLQMAGLLPTGPGTDIQTHRRPGATPASFSLLHYAGGQLVCAESANAPADHMALRKLLETGANPAPALACDPAVALKSLA